VNKINLKNLTAMFHLWIILPFVFGLESNDPDYYDSLETFPESQLCPCMNGTEEFWISLGHNVSDGCLWFAKSFIDPKTAPEDDYDICYPPK
jgi:hypothetical protein